MLLGEESINIGELNINHLKIPRIINHLGGWEYHLKIGLPELGLKAMSCEITEDSCAISANNIGYLGRM